MANPPVELGFYDATFARTSTGYDALAAADSLQAVGQLGDIALSRVVLLGIPGAGKTSLVEAMQDSNPELHYISLGAISRGLDPDSSQRKELDRLFALGRPAGSPELFLDILEPHIDRAMARSGAFILDGMPKKASEVKPLMTFLAEKNAEPDAIISCEAAPLVAHRRIMERSSRAGDPDSMNIFLNRTKTYLRDLDIFKKDLAGEGQTPVITVDTEKAQPDILAQAVQMLFAAQEKTPADTVESAVPTLHEAMQSKDRAAALNIYGQFFDDILPEINHGLVSSAEFDECRQVFVELAFATKEPHLRETPLFLQRLAKNYIDTTLMSLGHLAESLEEEAVLRDGEAYSQDTVAEIFAQQLGLKELIASLQERLVDGKDVQSLLEQEIVANYPELKHLAQVFAQRAGQSEEQGAAQPTIYELMALQSILWGQLTSNQTIMSPDLNYRRAANGVPGSHHSLLPFTRNKRAFSANSMGNYIPFVEAVSASGEQYNSTFGFIHFMGLDEEGQAFGVEYPIMMHDQKLLNLNSPTVNGVLRKVDEFYSNHDLWHNLLPVFSRSFILHHPDAPLSYGGRLEPYLGFGDKLRQEKEEYEIGVAMAHAKTQLERFENDPEYEAQQMGLLLDALNNLRTLPQELAGKVDEAEIADITDYLASMVATKAYNVFPDGHKIYDAIEPILTELGVSPLTIQASDVASLLYAQGLFDTKAAYNLAAKYVPDFSPDDLQDVFTRDETLAAELLATCIDEASAGRESGAEHIVGALRAWGVLDSLEGSTAVSLTPLQKSRWLAMNAPQRVQLKGHMEKVYGKPGYTFGGEVVSDPRDLVLLQRDALQANTGEYEYRVAARAENQRLGYAIYSLLFDDNQDSQRLARSELAMIRHSKDTGQKLFAKELVGHLDTILHDLVTNSYTVSDDDVSYIESYAHSLEKVSPLGTALANITARYRHLATKERAHLKELGIDYATAAKRLTEEHMDIA